MQNGSGGLTNRPALPDSAFRIHHSAFPSGKDSPMRKDVRIGLSIGGVLLAVLIVYLLVPKDANSGKNNGQKVARNGTDGTGQGGGDATGNVAIGGSTAGQGGSAATDPGQSLAHTGGTGPGDAASGQSQQDPNPLARGNESAAGTGA